jgi:cysteinyl-tRNA synthetase
MHGGGVDLIFPHHENEIAQSQASTGETFTNFWIHHGMVNLSGEKMSKSTDHFFLASDVFAQVDPTVVRYYLLTTHFRSPIEFSEERLGEAKTALERLLGFIEEGLRGTDGAGPAPEVTAILKRGEQGFREAMEDDFNSAKALGQLFEMVREINRHQADRGSQVPREAALKVRDLLVLVGVRVEERQLEVPARALELLEARNEARASKDWAKADAYRDQLRDMGFEIEDRPSGSVLKRG